MELIIEMPKPDAKHANKYPPTYFSYVERKTYTISESLWLANHTDELHVVVAVLNERGRQLKFIGKMFFWG